MTTVPAQSFSAPARAGVIAAARFMPGVCAVLLSSSLECTTRTPCSRHFDVVDVVRSAPRPIIQRVGITRYAKRLQWTRARFALMPMPFRQVPDKVILSAAQFPVIVARIGWPSTENPSIVTLLLPSDAIVPLAWTGFSPILLGHVADSLPSCADITVVQHRAGPPLLTE